MLWWPSRSILVHSGAPHGRPYDPSMTSSDSYPFSSAHSIQKWVILVTQDKFKKILLSCAMVTIMVHFGPFWCTSCATPRPLCTDSYSLSSIHVIQKEIKYETPDKFGTLLLCHEMVTILVHFGPFWSILVHLMGDPTSPLHRIFKKSSKICILRIKSF